MAVSGACRRLMHFQPTTLNTNSVALSSRMSMIPSPNSLITFRGMASQKVRASCAERCKGARANHTLIVAVVILHVPATLNITTLSLYTLPVYSHLSLLLLSFDTLCCSTRIYYVMQKAIADAPRIAFALPFDGCKRHGNMPIVIGANNGGNGANYGLHAFKLVSVNTITPTVDSCLP